MTKQAATRLERDWNMTNWLYIFWLRESLLAVVLASAALSDALKPARPSTTPPPLAMPGSPVPGLHEQYRKLVQALPLLLRFWHSRGWPALPDSACPPTHPAAPITTHMPTHFEHCGSLMQPGHRDQPTRYGGDKFASISLASQGNKHSNNKDN